MVGAFPSQNLSSSVTHDRSRAILTSSPMLMHWESWMANGAFSSGRRLPAATRKSLTVSWPWIHNWFATPGSPASRKWRKRLVEVQYLRTTITDEQRQEFGYLVEETIRRIEAGHFMPHSGIRFPQNPCTTCSYIGLCLGRPELAQNRLVRRSEALQCILLCFCFCTSDKHSLWKEVARYPLNLDSHVYDGLLVFC